MKPLHAACLAPFLAIAISTSNAQTQADIGNIIENSFNDNALNSSDKTGVGAPASDQSFWRRAAIETTYTFAHADFKQFPASEDRHFVTPELYLESQGGLILDFTATYGHIDQSLQSGFLFFGLGQRMESDLYGCGIQPAIDLLRATKSPWADRMRLVLGTGGQYFRLDTELQSPFGPAKTSADFYSVTPFALFQYKFSSAVSGTVIASSLSQFQSGPSFYTGTVNGHYYLFSLTARGDFNLCDHLTLSPFIIWRHEIDRSSGFLATPVLYDWAQLGASVYYNATENWRFYAGYSYVAFRPDYDQHIVQARVEYRF